MYLPANAYNFHQLLCIGLCYLCNRFFLLRNVILLYKRLIYPFGSMMYWAMGKFDPERVIELFH